MVQSMRTYLSFQVFAVLAILAFHPLAGWAKAPATVKIGVIVAQSGKAREYGDAAIKGAQLAMDEINQQGGVLNRPIALVMIDNQSTALNARKAAQKAVFRKVTAVVGAVWSTHSLAIAPVLQENRIPMISPGSTAPNVTRIGNYIFRTCYTDDFQGKLMANFALQALGHRKAAVLTNFSETYSQILAQYFITHFESNGGAIVYSKGYKGSANDFRNLLTPLKTKIPEIIFLPGYSRDSGLIMKQAHHMGIEAVFMGGDAWETAVAEFAGRALEGSYFSTFWHPLVPYARSRNFTARFRSAYGEEEISAYTPLAYDAVWLLSNAMQRSNSLAPEAIRDALASTREFDGATGRFSFNAYGDPVDKGASIMQFKNGRWEFHKAFTPQ